MEAERYHDLAPGVWEKRSSHVDASRASERGRRLGTGGYRCSEVSGGVSATSMAQARRHVWSGARSGMTGACPSKTFKDDRDAQSVVRHCITCTTGSRNAAAPALGPPPLTTMIGSNEICRSDRVIPSSPAIASLASCRDSLSSHGVCYYLIPRAAV